MASNVAAARRGPLHFAGWRLPVSYLNFYVGNRRVQD